MTSEPFAANRSRIRIGNFTGFGLLDEAHDLGAAAAGPDEFAEFSEPIHVDWFAAFVKGVFDHRYEIAHIVNPFFRVSRKRKHGAIFVRQCRLQGWHTIT